MYDKTVKSVMIEWNFIFLTAKKTQNSVFTIDRRVLPYMYALRQFDTLVVFENRMG